MLRHGRYMDGPPAVSLALTCERKMTRTANGCACTHVEPPRAALVRSHGVDALDLPEIEAHCRPHPPVLVATAAAELCHADAKRSVFTGRNEMN